MRYNTVATNRLLMILIALDIAFLVIHLYWQFGIVHGDMFKISKDGGYAEMYQYVKSFSAGVILMTLAYRHRSALLAFWGAMSFYLFLDDALRIHEQLGGKVMGGELKGIISKSYHQGQALYGLLFLLIISSIGFLLWRKASPFARQASYGILFAIGILGFASVGIDYVHAMLTPKGWNTVAVMLEEGGEHLGITLLLWFSACALLSNKAAVKK